MASYLDHVGYRVADLDWYISFFEAVFEMGVEKQRTNPDGSREVWLVGGLQLCETPGFAGDDGRAHHLCLITDNVEAARERHWPGGAQSFPSTTGYSCPTDCALSCSPPCPVRWMH